MDSTENEHLIYLCLREGIETCEQTLNDQQLYVLVELLYCLNSIFILIFVLVKTLNKI